MSGLRVAVVGAGIAGLTLAAWLRRAGVECVVYEQAERPREVGMGVQLAPNGARLLHRLGLAAALDRIAVRPSALEIRRWRDGRVVGWTTLGAEGEAWYGAPYYTLARPDLYRCLLGAAGDIQVGRRLAGLRPTRTGVQLSFVDGSAATADLVVGADGVHSVVRSTLAAGRPRYAGLVVHRALVPADRLPRPAGNRRVTIFLGPGRHIVWYPVSARSYSVAAVVAEPAGGGRGRAPSDPDRVRAGFAGWHPEVSEMLAAATGLTRWPLFERSPLAGWGSGRVTLIGDAAHPLLPFGAQGANQAIESAVTLATCLGEAASGLDGALERYARIRAPRLDRIAAMVRHNAADVHLPDGPAQCRRDRALSERGPGDLAWLFGYDAEAVLTGSAAGPSAAVPSLR